MLATGRTRDAGDYPREKRVRKHGQRGALRKLQVAGYPITPKSETPTAFTQARAGINGWRPRRAQLPVGSRCWPPIGSGTPRLPARSRRIRRDKGLPREQGGALTAPVACYLDHTIIAGAAPICGLVSSAAYPGASAGGSPVSLVSSLPVSPVSSSLVPQVPPSARISTELKARVRSASIRRIFPPFMFQHSTIPDLDANQRCRPQSPGSIDRRAVPEPGWLPNTDAAGYARTGAHAGRSGAVAASAARERR